MAKKQTKNPKKAIPEAFTSKLATVRRVAGSPLFAKWYAATAVLLLVGTTVFWSVLGAHVHAGNADQLVNSYLFEDNQTFREAQLPGQHSFLMKWPLFLLLKLCGFSAVAFVAATVGVTLLTVLALGFILWRIERRWLVFGTLCLALASTLLLVPAQPYAGGLLPVNMAMVTTRNLEYVLFIASLYLVVRSSGFKNRNFWFAVVGLSVVVASDKLFLTISAGGALLALLFYSFTKRWSLVTLAVQWFVASGLSAIVGTAVLMAINLGGFGYIVNQSGASPYATVDSLRDIVLGGVYAVLGLLTNFGANPAFDATVLKDLPHQFFARLRGIGGLAFMVNALVFGAGLWWSYKLLLASTQSYKHRKMSFDNAAKLSLLLLWTTVAALGVFVASKHYYAVDERYLGIALFAVFIAGAVYMRHKRWRPERLVLTGAGLLLAMVLGSFSAWQTYHASSRALSDMNKRNELVAQAVAQHPVQALVGDYWRVIPTKALSKPRLQVVPLADCMQPRTVLTSKTWQGDLRNDSFAYLLSLDRGLTDYPQCTLDEIVKVFGRPNASTLIAGSVENPKELLLFYDRGTRQARPNGFSNGIAPTQSVVLPISLEDLPHTTCARPTVMNVVAHQDDDLLFMSPDLLRDVQAGHCIRTVYVTAGDAGDGPFYWLSREQGSEAAYEQLLGANATWIQHIVKLPGGQFVTIVSPKGNAKISLIFMHLPDGNMQGQGFKSSHFESLQRLEIEKTSPLHTVDGQSKYTEQGLVNALTELMQVFRPTEIHTQAPHNVGDVYPDHSDHTAVGRFTQKARAQYERQYEGQLIIPTAYYIGYPTHQMLENVEGPALQDKIAAFLAYAQFDGGVCQTAAQCEQTPTYGAYLRRQYQLVE